MTSLYLHYFVSNGSGVQWSQVVQGPITTHKTEDSATKGICHGPNPFQNVSYATRIESNESILLGMPYR